MIQCSKYITVRNVHLILNFKKKVYFISVLFFSSISMLMIGEMMYLRLSVLEQIVQAKIGPTQIVNQKENMSQRLAAMILFVH